MDKVECHDDEVMIECLERAKKIYLKTNPGDAPNLSDIIKIGIALFYQKMEDKPAEPSPVLKVMPFLLAAITHTDPEEIRKIMDNSMNSGEPEEANEGKEAEETVQSRAIEPVNSSPTS